MKPCLLDPHFAVYTHRLGAEAGDILPPFEGREYACLVALGTTGISDDARRHLARELVRTNCRYAVLFGPGYDPLLTDLVYANSEDPRFNDPNEGVFMMHWHEGPDPEEAVYNLFALCDHGDSHHREFLILFINTDAEIESEVLDCVPGQLEEGRSLWGIREWITSREKGKDVPPLSC